MRVALLGFGLIGGSIARALRRDGGDWRIAAWSPSGDGPGAALAQGVIDEASPSPRDAIEGADLVVLAGPPLATLALIDDIGRGGLAASLGPAALVTDVASTKEAIGQRADDAGLRFVGGHPMAGRELAGYRRLSGGPVRRPAVGRRPRRPCRAGRSRSGGSAGRCLRRHSRADDRPRPRRRRRRRSATCRSSSRRPSSKPSPARAMDRTVRTGPRRPALRRADGRGMTRLARGDEEMGAGIVATNGPAIAARLRDLRTALDGWLLELERDGRPPMPRSINARLAAAQAAARGGARDRATSSSSSSHATRSSPATAGTASERTDLSRVPRDGRTRTGGSRRDRRWRRTRRSNRSSRTSSCATARRYFLMRRTRAGGDARLHDRWSIGVGGHLNPGDEDLDGGLRREWRRGARGRLRARVPRSSGC